MTFIEKLRRSGLTLLGAAVLATPAVAHVTFGEPKADGGSYYVGFLRVSHGCAGSPTVSLRVMLPPSIISAKPQPKPGWALTIEKAPLTTPLQGESSMIRERITAITWTGRLDPEQFDQFGIMMKIPNAAGPLYFPTVQRCEIGENAWTMIPAAGKPWHSVKSPAPVIDVTSVGPVAPMAGMKM